MTMKGWEFRKTNEPLVLVEKEIPKAKEGYVVIEVDACGLCHTDYATITDPGWMDILGKVPVILGHEIAGRIIEVGEGVENFKVGDRVAVCPMAGKDGTGAGNGRDGGYATHTTAPEEMLIHVPDNVDIRQAAASTDAGMTSHHAVVGRGEVKEGTKVGMIGIGGLGDVGIQVAVAKGAKVYASSRRESAQARARELGAVKTAANIKEFKDDELDVIIDFAGAGVTTAEAIETVKPGGIVVIVGMAKLESAINTGTMILNEIDLRGSVGGTKEDIEDIIKLMQEEKVEIMVQETTFDKVPEGLDRIHAGEINGRLIMMNK